MNIRTPNTDQFVQDVPQPTQLGLDNFLGNVSALQDPSGTLQRMQAEQIAKASADVKTDGITDQFKGYALKAIEDYQNKSTDMYRSNKGFNRLNLSAQQMLDEQKNYKNLLMDVNSLKSLTDDYKKTMEQVHKDVAANIITPEDYNAFDTEYKTRLASAKGIGDLPIAQSVYNKYLAKNTAKDWLAKLDAQMKIPLETGSKRTNVQLDTRTGKYMNVVNYDPVVDAMPLVRMSPEFQRGLRSAVGDDPARQEQFLRERYNVNGSTFAPGQMSVNINNNMGNGFDNKKGLYAVPFVASNEPMQTGNKEKTVASEVMNLESIGKQVPWVGQVKDENGKPVEVNGFITRIVKDNHGGVYARVQGTYKKDSKDSWGTAEQGSIVRDIPYTLEMNAKLHEEKIDVDPIRQRFGAGKKDGTKSKQTEADKYGI